MSSLITSKSELSDAFYQQPCWLDIWLDQCSTTQLEFWSRFDEFDALVPVIPFGASRICCSAWRSHSTAFSGSSDLLPESQILPH